MKNKAISEDRKQYLRKVKAKKVVVIVTQLAIVLGFIILWEILANANVIDSFITSKPSRIWQTLTNLGTNGLIKHINVTVYETIVGFCIGTLSGIIIAIILWWSKFLSKVTEPFLVVLNSLPKVALRTNRNHMGRSWNTCNYCNGGSNLFSSYNIRKSKWIYKNR